MKISLILFINVESSLFVGANGFQCNPCPQIYIPTNALTSICLIFIKFIPTLLPMKLRPTNEENFGYPRTMIPTNKNTSTIFCL